MKHLSVVVAPLAIGALACSSIVPQALRGPAHVIEESYAVEGFSEIELDTIANVEPVQGDHESLVVETDDNILPYVQAKATKAKLVLSDKGNVMLLPSGAMTSNGAGRRAVQDLKCSTVGLDSEAAGTVELASETPSPTVISIGSGDVLASDPKGSSAVAHLNALDAR